MSLRGVPLVEKVTRLHDALASADLPHAFGGALALAWCVGQPRGTADIDVNVLVGVDDLPLVLDALPDEVAVSDAAVQRLRQEGQARLWWERTPVDVFLNTTEFHDRLVDRVRLEDVTGQQLPFLDCHDLAVFKAFFDRGKDWVDLEQMLGARTLQVEVVLGTLVRHLGGDDPRVERLRSLAAAADPTPDR